MLVKEPFNLSIDQIKKLTPYQVKNLYFRPKTADEPVGQYQSAKEIFWKVQRDWRGLSEEETQKLWIKQSQQPEAPKL